MREPYASPPLTRLFWQAFLEVGQFDKLRTTLETLSVRLGLPNFPMFPFSRVRPWIEIKRLK